jgi:MFS family permease
MMPIRSGPAKVGDVSPEVLVLALSTVVRPTSAAAVFAMLAAARPTRLLLAYIIAGAAFSGGFGVVVVILLSGWTRPEAQDDVRAVIGIVVGAVSLGYAAGVLSGRVRKPAGDADDTNLAPDAGSWLGRQLADLSVPRAAVVGVLTHLPGLFYIAALNAIASSTSSIVDQIFQVAVYNGFWFALPTSALVLATRRPVELQDFLRRVTGWVSHREREILVTAFGLLGTYLIVKGVVELLP